MSDDQEPQADSPDSLKADLRTNFLTMRSALADAEPDAVPRITQRLHEILAGRTDAVVGGYMAIKGEIDLMPAYQAFHEHGFTMCLPVTPETQSALIFRRWSPGQDLVTGQFSILEPDESCDPVVPDILLVPLLAFDRAGGRLGFGQGYYDRTLSHLRSHRKIAAYGIAYAGQEADHVPLGPHDQRLDAVVTPAEIITVEGPG